MTSYALFALLVLAGGTGAFVGSVLGNAFGRTGLFAGALIGGTMGSAAAAFLGAAFKWLNPAERLPTAIGAAAGFLVAATIAVNTLSSPIGPVTSALLIGVGGLLGRRWARRRRGEPVRHVAAEGRRERASGDAAGAKLPD